MLVEAVDFGTIDQLMRYSPPLAFIAIGGFLVYWLMNKQIDESKTKNEGFIKQTNDQNTQHLEEIRQIHETQKVYYESELTDKKEQIKIKDAALEAFVNKMFDSSQAAFDEKENALEESKKYYQAIIEAKESIMERERQYIREKIEVFLKNNTKEDLEK